VIIGLHNHIEIVLEQTRAEKDQLVAALAQRTEEVNAASNALAELAQHKQQIEIALEQTRAEKDLCLLKTPKGQESLEIFAPPPYRRGHDHNSFRPRFPALVPCSQPRLTGA
jgi:hypothetical protein